MGPGLFVIAILGCADGSAACTPVATLPARYETRAQCVAQTEAALTNNSDFDFPSLVAECREAKQPSAQKSPDPRIEDQPVRRG
jgi:acyl-CoA synthetase (AMP-forming)/AMP-acid ligase II